MTKPGLIKRRIGWLATALFMGLAIAGTAGSQSPQAPPVLIRADRHPVPSLRWERQRFQIRSAILDETRPVTIALPPSFRKSAASRRYPVIVILDGEAASAEAVMTAAAELARWGAVPESVLVAVDNIGGAAARLRDLTPPGLSVSGSSLREGGDTFLDFLEKELLPSLDSQFRTGVPRTLVGHSSGGILATYAAASRDVFRLVVSLDAPVSLGDNWLGRQLQSRARLTQTPLRYASYGALYEWTDTAWSSVQAAAPSSWRLHQETLPNESHNSMPLLGAYLGLRSVFLEYSWRAAPAYPTTSVLGYYDRLAPVYGGAVEPPEALLSELVDDLLLEGRGAEARATFDRRVSAYGPPANAAALLTEIEKVERQPPPEETVEALLSTPFSTAAEATAFLGVWEGQDWIHPEARHPFTLELTAESGRVVGRVVEQTPDGTQQARPLEYFRVTPEGMTYGYMNGMRPRAVLLFELRGHGDELIGEMRWGGVAFRVDGDAPPIIRVRLRRAR